MKTVWRTLLVAVLAISLCTVLVIGGTYSLFSDRVTVGNHLQAGTLKAELWRTGLTKVTLNERTGLLTEETNNTATDFTGRTDQNLFGQTAQERLVPGASYDVTLSLRNTGSVAFDYTVTITLLTEESDAALAGQLSLTVNGEERGRLSDYLDGSETARILFGSMTKETAETTLRVKLAFVDDGTDGSLDNDFVQDKRVSFDLTVSAVQKTA